MPLAELGISRPQNKPAERPNRHTDLLADRRVKVVLYNRADATETGKIPSFPSAVWQPSIITRSAQHAQWNLAASYNQRSRFDIVVFYYVRSQYLARKRVESPAHACELGGHAFLLDGIPALRRPIGDQDPCLQLQRKRLPLAQVRISHQRKLAGRKLELNLRQCHPYVLSASANLVTQGDRAIFPATAECFRVSSAVVRPACSEASPAR